MLKPVEDYGVAFHLVPPTLVFVIIKNAGTVFEKAANLFAVVWSQKRTHI